MDCRIAQQNIDLFVDGMLGENERQQLLVHAASCVRCQKALDDALRLKDVLSSLGELEPPQGLAMSAIRKTKKKKPLFAYVSVAAAAVAASVGLVVVLTSGVNMDSRIRMTDESAMFSMRAAEDGAGAAEMAPAAPQEQADMMMDDGVAEEAQAALKSEAADVLETKEPKVAFRAEAYISEEEFVSSEGGSYYKPVSLPEDALLESISVDEESIKFTYRLDDQSAFVFEWLDALDQNALKDWLRIRFGDDLSGVEFDGVYYIAAGQDATDVYWVHGGDVLHAIVPTWFTSDDIAAYCTAQFVIVETDQE